MKAYIISDAEFQNAEYTKLHDALCGYLSKSGFQIEEKSLHKEELAFCKGCFDCWVKKPGECIVEDEMGHINFVNMNSDVVFYLTPVVFGQFSANIKNVIDRWLPNILPFFERDAKGLTSHVARYPSYPKQIIIGYFEVYNEVEAELFLDIIQRHLGSYAGLIWQKDHTNIADLLDGIALKRVGEIL